eukprot:scaffold3278_cov376-Prasinococcus_capsulatus_cf.AAC.2
MGYNILSLSPDTALFANPYPTLKSYHFSPYKILLPGLSSARATGHGGGVAAKTPMPNSFVYVHGASLNGTAIKFLDKIVNEMIAKVDASRKAKEDVVDLLLSSELQIQFLALGAGEEGSAERWRKVRLCAQPTDHLRLPSDVLAVARQCQNDQDLAFVSGIPGEGQLGAPAVYEEAIVVPSWVSNSGREARPTLIARFQDFEQLIPQRHMLSPASNERATKVGSRVSAWSPASGRRAAD